MIAGGSGITPMVQVLNHVFADPEDKTFVSLVYANKSPEDILLKEWLDHMQERFPNRFRVHYVVDSAPSNWKDGSFGRINAEMIQKRLPSPSDDAMIFVCGPDPMLAAISGPKAPDYSRRERRVGC
eukprot:GABV01001883.1.p1 GENE.GABV01001883.1~~GABV01001883.1.p1  ORF type:complete len:126 (-),score=39.93 GABV01001883.1:129-506(-)